MAGPSLSTTGSVTTGGSHRVRSIDVLRGTAMVLMALDHARDYFGDIRLDPSDLESATPALFFTRWVTHFCAPVFVFLAGMGIGLRGRRETSRGVLSRYLLLRGMWLVLLEVTVVNFTWLFTFRLGIVFFQVIAAIGVGMIGMAALVHLPDRLVLGIGLLVAFGHPLLAFVDAQALGVFGTVWPLLYGGTAALPEFGGVQVIVLYSCLPWLGVMALGYGCAPLMREPIEVRSRRWIGTGAMACLLFVVLRLLDVGGEPRGWSAQDSLAMTGVAFLNCTKYPPSPLFLLMTLGPACLALGWLERTGAGRGRWLATLGRVPLFFYLIHVLVIHLAALAWNAVEYGRYLSPMQAGITGSFPPEYERGLLEVYLGWALVILILYPPCAAFARRKEKARSPKTPGSKGRDFERVG